LMMSSCHQASHRTSRLKIQAGDAARFIWLVVLVQSVDGVIENPAGESGVKLLRR
jgi:hypothetical protein